MNNTKLIASFTLMILAITLSCTPAIKHPDLSVEKSEQWLAQNEQYAFIDSAWWSDFDDTMIDSLLAETFKNNYTLQIASANLEAAEAQKTIAGSGFLPSVDVSISGSRREQSLVNFPSFIRNQITNPINTFGVSANVGWELDLWGRVRNAHSAAVANFQATQADFEGYKLSLAAQSIKAWFAAIEAEKQLELANKNLESYQLSEERITARYEKGIRPSLDYRLSRTSVATAESQLYQRIQISELTKRQVEFILGRYPAAHIALSDGLPQNIKEIPAGIPADIINRRPDIIAAERRLAAADCNVSAAKAALFPSIRLTASGGTSTEDLADILNMDFSVWSIAAGVVQPIFQGGRLRANVKISEAVRKQAFASYANTVLTAYAEIESILSSDKYLKKQEAAVGVAADQALASEELAEDRYYKGLADIVTLLEARRQANNAVSQLLTIQRLRLENRVDFYVALGGGVTEQGISQ